ncbi:transposable element Tcb2 transposase [Trichonephila clavipes]|nr:transposable element Tcb2 transposase [Trichonephila clavipes]
MTAKRYVHDILQSHVLPLMQWLPGAIYQQDNARLHTARVSQDCLRTVSTLPWPAGSPDLPPIEHIGDHLGRRVRHPTSLNEPEARVQQIWNEISQELVCLNARFNRKFKLALLSKMVTNLTAVMIYSQFGLAIHQMTRASDNEEVVSPLEEEHLLRPYCSRMKHRSHMRNPSITIPPMYGFWRTLIVRNHVILNNVSLSVFWPVFLETTSLDHTVCPVSWTVGHR